MKRRARPPLPIRVGRLVVALAVVAAAAYFGVPLATNQTAPSSPTTPPPADAIPAPTPTAATDLGASQAKVVRLMREQRSGVMVAFDAKVLRTIRDDNDGARHQRFILSVADESAPHDTILVAHNIDLAERVPVEAGDIVSLYGQYEFNAEGGVVHWTHHDPDGRHEGGWIELDGVRYE